MKNPNRTTLLITCSVGEAQQIRAAAKKQDRTISAYVLRAVMTRLNIERQVAQVANRKERLVEDYAQRAKGLR